MSDRVEIKVPGKLFLAGEYGVVKSGGLAIVVAISADFTVSIQPTRKKNSEITTNVDMLPFHFDVNGPILYEKTSWVYAIEVVRALNLRGKEQVKIHIESSLGFSDTKTGYGSSAAVVVGMIRALDSYYQLHLSIEKLLKLSINVHKKVQGSGSGADVAAILLGGIISYQNEGEIKRLSNLTTDFYVIKTGKSIKTAEKLVIRLSDEFYDQSNQVVKDLQAAANFQAFKALLLKNQDLLTAALPPGYLTDELKFALEVINESPKLAAKVSGSGFGENLLVLADGVKDFLKSSIAERLRTAGLKVEKLRVAEAIGEIKE